MNLWNVQSPFSCLIQIKRGRGRVVQRNILREFHMETLNVHYKGFPINKITVRDVEPSPCLKQRALVVCVYVHFQTYTRIHGVPWLSPFLPS